MRNRTFVALGMLAVVGGIGFLSVTGSSGHPPAIPQPLPADIRKEPAIPAVLPPAQPLPVRPAAAIIPVAPVASATHASPADRYRNIALLPPATRESFLRCQLSIDWLFRQQLVNGRFTPGRCPALDQILELDNPLWQAKATFAASRGARFTGEKEQSIKRLQAVLALLLQTVEPSHPGGMREPAMRAVLCNRLAFASFALLAIAELPDSPADVVDKGEQLALFLRQLQAPDGSLNWGDEDARKVEPDGGYRYPALALYAVMLSNRNRPASWKPEFVRKGLAHYRQVFRTQPHPEMVPWATAAAVEYYQVSKDPAALEMVCEMNDWLCTQQYEQMNDRTRALWRGGFVVFENSKPGISAPKMECTLAVQSLSDACRLLNQIPKPDVQRYDRYCVSLVRGLQFLMSLQYTEGTTQQFVPGYRPLLMGGFHASHENGDLRVDHSALGVSTFVQYLESGAAPINDPVSPTGR